MNDHLALIKGKPINFNMDSNFQSSGFSEKFYDFRLKRKDQVGMDGLEMDEDQKS